MYATGLSTVTMCSYINTPQAQQKVLLFRFDMEYFIIISLVCAVLYVIYTWNWAWFMPKKLEKLLRAQGFDGNSYRLLHGDFKEMTKLVQQAHSKPINIQDDIVPRSIPYNYHLVQKYGAKSIQWLGPRPTVHIMDPQLVKEILAKNFQFLKPQPHPLEKYFARGLVSYNGEKWAKQRKLLNPAFHMEKLKLMLPAFYLSCVETLSRWENIVASSNGTGELDVWPHIQTMTSDAISRTAFGTNYEDGRKVFELLKEQTKLFVLAVGSVYLPGMRFLPTKTNRRTKQVAKRIEVLIKDLINGRIKVMKSGEARPDDLLSILVESNLEAIEDERNKKFAENIQDIIEECKLFYFAGQETTATLLVWTMVLLCKHPEWQERGREEVLREFGHEKPRFEGLNQLKVVTMILYEVLRLYPPILFIGRRTSEDMKLGNLTLPGGVHIQIPTMLVHHDLELWGADAKEFKPERFAEGVLKATKGNTSFFPFGWGPRICIGQNFAMLEAKLAMTMILQRFSFELSPSYAHAPYTMVTLQPQYGAHLILHKM